jgi:hypothetical protein
MTDSPYRPPKAHVADPPAPEIRPGSRKPLATWSLQAVVLVAAFILALGSLGMGYALINEGQTVELFVILAIEVLWRIVASAVLVMVTLQVQRRTALGRALGLAVIALVMVVTVVAFLNGLPGIAEADRLMGWSLVLLTLLTVLSLWAYSFGFSRAARTYFVPRN